LPSSPSSHKSSSESTKSVKIYKTEEDEESIFKLYYEDNKNLLENEYPDMPKGDIKRYLRKTWDNMDIEYRKKFGLHMTNESSHLHSKESSPDEDEISVEIDTTIKENKKTKSKIDREENSVSETKRSRLHNLFKGMKQEKVCQICEKTGKLTRCKGPCYSYFHLSCVKPGESSPEYSVDENTLDDRLLSDLNIIKRSINNESENNGNYENIYIYICICQIDKKNLLSFKYMTFIPMKGKTNFFYSI